MKFSDLVKLIGSALPITFYVVSHCKRVGFSPWLPLAGLVAGIALQLLD